VGENGCEMSDPTEQEVLDQIRVSKILGPHYYGSQARPPQPGVWLFKFAIEVGTETYVFHATVPASLPEPEREADAVRQFKEIVALIAKKSRGVLIPIRFRRRSIFPLRGGTPMRHNQ